MDISSYQICSDPKTWVFDDLVSAALLDHVDHNFSPQVSLVNSAGSVDTWRVADPVLAEEFIDLLVQISGIKPVANSLQQVTLGNVLKKNQWCHMDRLEVGGKFPHIREDAIGFLDMSKQDVRTRYRSDGHSRYIIPTTSFVVYFEDYPGGINFPNAPGFDSAATVADVRRNEDGSMSIDGRRGRIIMFQNYHIDHSSVNSSARHFGTFDPLVPKRNWIGGLVSNENPPDYILGESHSVPGLLYGVCESIVPTRPIQEQIQDEYLPPQGYRFGWHGGHHEYDGSCAQVDEEEERLMQLLAASISRETATQHSILHKQALLHLLTVFSKVDSVRESASMKPMHSDIWWYILSMMNGRDLIPKNVEEEGSEDEHKEKKRRKSLSNDSFVDT